jgi:hypothetical protein
MNNWYKLYCALQVLQFYLSSEPPFVYEPESFDFSTKTRKISVEDSFASARLSRSSWIMSHVS